LDHFKNGAQRRKAVCLKYMLEIAMFDWVRRVSLYQRKLLDTCLPSFYLTLDAALKKCMVAFATWCLL